MPNLSEISNGTKLLLGAGLLLLIATFLPWQDFGNELTGALGVDASFTAWRGIGVFMGLVLIALLAWVVVQVLNVKLNFDLPITEAWLTLGLGIAVFGLALIKLLTILDEQATIWSYLGVILAALVAFGAWLRAQELGGVGATASGATASGAATAGGTGAASADTMRDDSGGGMTAGTPGRTADEPATMPEAGVVPGAGVATPPPAPAAPAEPMRPAEPGAPSEPAPAEPFGEPRPDDEEPPSRPTGY